jgi:hypothetical protein
LGLLFLCSVLAEEFGDSRVARRGTVLSRSGLPFRLPHTNRLPAVAGRAGYSSAPCLHSNSIFLGSVLAEEYSDCGVTRHRTPSGSPGLPALPHETASRQSRVGGRLIILSRHACGVIREVRCHSTQTPSGSSGLPLYLSRTNRLPAVAGWGGGVRAGYSFAPCLRRNKTTSFQDE